MSREQRTRLNVMISEQTGAAASTKVPGRATQTEQTDQTDETEAQDSEAREPEGHEAASPATTPAGGLYTRPSPLARFAKTDDDPKDG